MQASAQIIALLTKMLPPSTPFERASIDEAYLDLTQLVEARLGGRSSTGTAAGAAAGSMPGALNLQ